MPHPVGARLPRLRHWPADEGGVRGGAEVPLERGDHRSEERHVDQHAAGAGRLHERAVIHAQTGRRVSDVVWFKFPAKYTGDRLEHVIGYHTFSVGINEVQRCASNRAWRFHNGFFPDLRLLLRQ